MLVASTAGLGNGIDTITILSSDCFPSLPINRWVIIFNRTLIIGIYNDGWGDTELSKVETRMFGDALSYVNCGLWFFVARVAPSCIDDVICRPTGACDTIDLGVCKNGDGITVFSK